jgi:hypothetical protein
MKTYDVLTIRGHVHAELFRPVRGRLISVQEEEAENIITTVGRAMLADLVLASTSGGAGKPTHMGVGTGSAAAAVGDTTLTAGVNVALTSKTRAANVITYVGDWAAGSATQTNQEAGLFDGAAGTMVGRVTYGAIAKGASDTLKVTWTWTLG